MKKNQIDREVSFSSKLKNLKIVQIKFASFFIGYEFVFFFFSLRIGKFIFDLIFFFKNQDLNVHM